jgi:hypothetical protein
MYQDRRAALPARAYRIRVYRYGYTRRARLSRRARGLSRKDQREDQRRDREDREDQRHRKDRKDQPEFEWRERWRERWSARERYAVEHCHLSWSASCVTMATGTDEQTLLLRARCISADSWGAGLPSFWCVELPQIGERRQFIVREEHALQFGAEFPECAGGHILSRHKRARPQWSTCTNRSAGACRARTQTARTDGKRLISMTTLETAPKSPHCALRSLKVSGSLRVRLLTLRFQGGSEMVHRITV